MATPDNRDDISLELLRQVHETLPDLVALKDQGLRVLYANKAFCEFHGKPLDAIAGATQAALEPRETAAKHAEQDGQVLTTGIIVNIPSEVLVRHDGIKAHFHTLRCPVRDAAGKVTRVITCSRAIQPEAHVTARGLRQSEQHNELLLSIIPDMYFRIGRDGTYLDFSAPKGTDTQLPPALFLGKKIHDVNPDLAPLVMTAVEAALRTGEVQAFEYKLYVHGGFIDYEARVLVSGPDEVVAIVRDITAQKRLEAEQRRLQEEVIRMQEMMMAELSTPLIPISDRVMVMPIIGSVDDQRANRMMERLLSGIVQQRAAVAILDVTGMSSVTTHTASALIRCAQAVRLLGASVLLTGLRPELARTLVAMDVDLAGIITLGTLQAGIAYAMNL